MNCNTPTDVTFSFTGFAQRGGRTDHHKDGWGIAFFEGQGWGFDGLDGVSSATAATRPKRPRRSKGWGEACAMRPSVGSAPPAA